MYYPASNLIFYVCPTFSAVVSVYMLFSRCCFDRFKLFSCLNVLGEESFSNASLFLVSGIVLLLLIL